MLIEELPDEDDTEDEMPPLQEPAESGAAAKELPGLEQEAVGATLGPEGDLLSEEEEEDEMPPLLLVGDPPPVPLCNGFHEKEEEEEEEGEEDEDDMPPLLLVNPVTTSMKEEAEEVTQEEHEEHEEVKEDRWEEAQKEEQDEEDEEEEEDEMPPLLPVGSVPTTAAEVAPEDPATEDEEEDMPPLLPLSAAAPEPSTVSIQAEVQAESKEEEQQDEKEKEEEEEQEHQKAPEIEDPTEGREERAVAQDAELETQGEAEQVEQQVEEDEEEEEEMPPLLPVGPPEVQRDEDVAQAAALEEEEDDEEEMPALLPTQPQTEVSSCTPFEEMPRAAFQPPADPVQIWESEEIQGDQVELPQVSEAQLTAPEPPAVPQELPEPPRKPKAGDLVRILGLRGLDGQLGRVMDNPQGSPERVPVELEEDGQTIPVRVDNLEVVPEEDDDSEDSMPPFAGGATASASSSHHLRRAAGEDESNQRRPRAKSAKKDSDSEESLPPLVVRRPDEEELRPNDLVVLVNLKMDTLNGAHGKVVRIVPPQSADAVGRVEMRLFSDGKLLSVKRPNVQRLMTEDAALNNAKDGDDSEDSSAGKAGHRAGAAINVGDSVLLKGLAQVEFNGQRAVVEQTGIEGPPGDARERVVIRLESSGKRLKVPAERLDRLQSDQSSDDAVQPKSSRRRGRNRRGRGRGAATPAPEGEGSDDSMPFLEFVGKVKDPDPNTSAHGEPQGTFHIGQRLILSTRMRKEYDKQVVVVVPSNMEKILAGQVTVQLQTGKRVVIREKHLEVIPDEGASYGPSPEQMAALQSLLERAAKATQSSDLATVEQLLGMVEAWEISEDWPEDLIRSRKLQVKRLKARINRLAQAPARPMRGLTNEVQLLPRPTQAEGGRNRDQHPATSEDLKPTAAEAKKRAAPLKSSLKESPQPEPSPAAPLLEQPPARASPKGAENRQKVAEGTPQPVYVPRPGLSPSHPSPPSQLSAVAQWCKELQLPESLIEQLEAEDVTDPQELAAIPEEELAAFAKGMKLGPKGRFLTAVKRMKTDLEGRWVL